MKHAILTGFSLAEIKQKIDAFLAEEKPFKAIDIIMPLRGALFLEYRGLRVREWHCAGNVRYDAAVELVD